MDRASWPVVIICVITELNISSTRQHGYHFADDSFKYIYFNENAWISIEILLKFVPKGPINNIPLSVPVRHYLNQWWPSLLTHICVIQLEWVNGHPLNPLVAAERLKSNQSTVKPVCNDHLYNKIYFLWFIQKCALMKTEGTNLLFITISAFWSSSRWPLAT